MKTNQKYAALSAVTAFAVVVMSLGALSFAQTVTPLTCTVAQASVATNQSVILTAAGGDGANYTWSGANLTTTNPSGAQFAVSFPNTGTYAVNVASGGQTATCNVNVNTTAATGALMCSPAVQTITLGQTASVSASGGNGTFAWSAPDLTISNPSGSGFSATYASAGLHTLTVTSNGNTSTCAINVIANGNTTPPVVTTPSLPDTGGGYGK